jgi:hypothetical protein
MWSPDFVGAKNIRYKLWNMVANNNQVPLEFGRPPQHLSETRGWRTGGLEE